MAEATETLPHGSYSPLTAPPSEVTLKQPVNIDIQLDHNPSVEPEMSLTGRPTDDGERRVVTHTTESGLSWIDYRVRRQWLNCLSRDGGSLDSQHSKMPC